MDYCFLKKGLWPAIAFTTCCLTQFLFQRRGIQANNLTVALAGEAQFVGVLWSVNEKVCGFNSQSGHMWQATVDVSLSKNQ